MSSLADPMIVAADERHIDALMQVMRSSFDSRYGEAWSALQLGGSLAMTGSFARQLLSARSDIAGFTLCRSAGPEIELLLIAVAPSHRGQGLGAMLVQAAIKDAVQRGASDIFLEVRENNLAARSLYRKAGFIEVGRRANYYAGSGGDRFAAITMRRRFDDFY